MQSPFLYTKYEVELTRKRPDNKTKTLISEASKAAEDLNEL